MCGRFTITVSKEEMKKFLKDKFSITNFNIDDYIPRFNAAPTQNILSIISDGINYRAGFLKWGFIPDNAKDTKFFQINTRSETIDEKPIFKRAFLSRRCIIPVDGFYEWMRGQNKKNPVRITLKDENIFALAGIWNTVVIDGKKIHTVSIVTTKANKLISPIHDRMPVILDFEKVKLWLDPKLNDQKVLKELLRPYSEERMTYYEVSDLVNNSKIDDPNLIKKIKV